MLSERYKFQRLMRQQMSAGQRRSPPRRYRNRGGLWRMAGMTGERPRAAPVDRILP